MILEIIIKGKIPELLNKNIKYDILMEKFYEYYKLSFKIKSKKEVDNILKRIDIFKNIEILNTSIEADDRKIELPNGINISLVGYKNQVYPNKKEIFLKKGLAFGGFHPTTIMCMELLIELLMQNIHINNAFDLGTGNGILAILANKLGIRDICAVDIDFQSCLECKDNIYTNKTQDNIKLICGTNECIKGLFDLIITNIIFHTLKLITKDITKKLNQNGFIIMSGFLAHDTNSFLNMLGHGKLIMKKEKEGWGSILWQKK